MERIAIECKTKEEFYEVKHSFPVEQQGAHSWYERFNCINPVGLGNGSRLGTQSRCYYEDKGYTIISAQEYLGGRMEEIDQDKLCEFCRVYYDMSKSWHCEGVKCEEITEIYLNENKKENNMKENNINKNVLEVFGEYVTGKELDIIDRHFDDEMLKVIMMKKFFEEIKAACMEAEEKLKENID